ncbi:hypothetical protein FB45DRAFT_1069578 [Roridomyces roridus]|uniref:Uncharacterized protein n=1 Tax=Roridomyces roridus TaxID=1738132 RepID=A0AAD7AZ68_9AGAR|nr:hypothetical protein FB45DRAFT_1069578 [Roridomyces roridus]
MHLSIVFVLLGASLPALTQASPNPKPTAGNFPIVNSPVGAAPAPDTDAGIPIVCPFVPSPDHLIVNTTIAPGDIAFLGYQFRIIPSVNKEGNLQVFDGTAKNITTFYAPPGGPEQWLGGFESGPPIDSTCGFFSGMAFYSMIMDTSVVGTYRGRWVFEFGSSAQPHAPLSQTTGCGPEPFDIKRVEFVREWEVV